MFAFGFPLADQLLAGPGFAPQRLVRPDDFAHLFLDRGQIVHRERLAAGRGHHVIIKSVIRRRAKSDLRAGPQRLHRFGQHMSEIVARQFQRISLVPRGDQRQLRIAIEGAGQVAQFAIDARGQRGLGKAGTDRGGDIGRR